MPPSLRVPERQSRKPKSQTFAGINYTPGASRLNRARVSTAATPAAPPNEDTNYLKALTDTLAAAASLPPKIPVAPVAPTRPPFPKMPPELVGRPRREQAIGLLSRIRFDRFPIKPLLEVAPCIWSRDSFDVLISAAVADRVTGEPTHINSCMCFPFDRIENDDGFVHRFIHMVRERVISLLTHELDEMFLFDGARIFDPHAYYG